jgi:hypothetical protein
VIVMSVKGNELSEVESSRSRIPLMAEILGYVGAALVLTAGAAVMQDIWPGMEPIEQTIAIGVGAVAMFLAGLPLRRHPEEALSRLAGVLWVVSAFLMMWFTGLLLADVVGTEFGDTEFGLGLAGAAYSAVLLALRRGSLQQIPLYVGGIIGTFGFAVAFGPTDHFCTGTEPHWLTPSIMTFGGMWFAAIGVRVLQSTATALVLGAATVLGAPLFAVGDLGEIAPLMGLTIAMLLLVASGVFRSVALLVAGGLGLFGYLHWTVSRYFGESLGAPLTLLVAGAGVLVIALVAARRLGTHPGSHAGPAV